MTAILVLIDLPSPGSRSYHLTSDTFQVTPLQNYLPIGIAFSLSALLTPVVRALARRRGWVVQPRADRWHKQPTALLGGVAIVAAVAPVALLSPDSSPQFIAVIIGSLLLAGVGLIDDFRELKPYQKLIAQLLASAIVVGSGLLLPWTPWDVVNMGITVFWLVGITNAVNLLDNMDGLAGGIAAIAAGFLSVVCLGKGQTGEAVLLALLAAALLGFLIYNRHPASIFMGDCGSMFVGFFLAGAALMTSAGERSRSMLAVVIVPVLVLAIPIFNTTFVTILRKLFGRPISVGSNDHTSHRLVALGLSQSRAVWMLYGFALLSGGLAILAQNLRWDVALAVIVGFVLLLSLLGVHLAHVRVYSEEEIKTAQERPINSFLVDLSYKRRLFEVLMDAVLIGLSYYIASVTVQGPLAETGASRQFLELLPVLVATKLFAFLVIGVYRGLWRYVGIDDLVTHAKAVGLGTLLSVAALLLLNRFHGYSRAVFVLDAAILLMLVAASRVAFRLFRNLLPTRIFENGRRVIIYGAGDAGELLLRELRNNRDLGYCPVGFLDDDPLKQGTVIHGLRVLGGNGAFLDVCRRKNVDEVLISSSRFPTDRIAEIAMGCRSEGLDLKRLRLQLVPIDPSEEWSSGTPGSSDTNHDPEPALSLTTSEQQKAESRSLKADR